MPTQSTGARKARSRGEHMPTHSTGAREAHSRGEHILGPLIIPNKSTCLPKAHASGEHARAESTFWGQEFFN